MGNIEKFCRYRIQAENGVLARMWIRSRGGILVWESVNLSNPNRMFLSPAEYENGEPVTQKPSWECGNDPVRHIKSEDEVNIVTRKEVKRFHVATRMGTQGFMVKVTDGGTRRIRTAVRKAEEEYGKPAFHGFDYDDYENAVIYVEDACVPMEEWN